MEERSRRANRSATLADDPRLSDLDRMVEFALYQHRLRGDWIPFAPEIPSSQSARVTYEQNVKLNAYEVKNPSYWPLYFSKIPFKTLDEYANVACSTLNDRPFTICRLLAQRQWSRLSLPVSWVETPQYSPFVTFTAQVHPTGRIMSDVVRDVDYQISMSSPKPLALVQQCDGTSYLTGVTLQGYEFRQKVVPPS